MWRLGCPMLVSMASLPTIERITLREIRMPLVATFETSFGATTGRRIILIEVSGGGAAGWGEVTVGEGPFYNEDWTDSAWCLLKDFAIPMLLARPLPEVSEAGDRWSSIRENRM